jgi:membrane protein
MLGALWSSSAALNSIVNALNRAYDIVDRRPWWRVRLVAMGLTLALAVFMLFALSLVLSGPGVATYLGKVTGLGTPFKWAWLVMQWPLAIVLVSTAIGFIYYFGPDAHQPWDRVMPGALTATALWLLISLGFKAYVAKFTDYNASYGAIGGVIAVMLWLYVSSIAILVGAELNAEIEQTARERAAPEERRARAAHTLVPRVGKPFLERYEQKEEAEPPPSSVRLGS